MHAADVAANSAYHFKQDILDLNVQVVAQINTEMFADMLFALSMLKHTRITPDMAQEAVLASAGYLRMCFPEELLRRSKTCAAKE